MSDDIRGGQCGIHRFANAEAPFCISCALAFARDETTTLRASLITTAEDLSKAVDKVMKHEGTIVVLRAALHNAKRDCTRACFERSIGNEKFDCICGAVQHNDAIDAVLKETK